MSFSGSSRESLGGLCHSNAAALLCVWKGLGEKGLTLAVQACGGRDGAGAPRGRINMLTKAGRF